MLESLVPVVAGQSQSHLIHCLNLASSVADIKIKVPGQIVYLQGDPKREQ